ncbi:DUF3987 domain-containing protein [Bifidobacterium sp. SO4]|uniref:DUF3987 domain-containing protein n=1 Tax=Bifidobacterium sp. SO4 TaxID=2809030 RepID=UPI001BDBE2B7|nr:DUF3987 domain-containing protein [Bifidobacterium sp. SO4]MBT1171362.1 DUF3987 domain-containing protein [Bifidobacterium sp. SO4]
MTIDFDMSSQSWQQRQMNNRLVEENDVNDIMPGRGEIMGDGIPRTAEGVMYDPLESCPEDNDQFWKSSVALSEIRLYARSRGIRVNPWALLSAVLCRLSVALPPTVVIDPLNNMQPMPLNVFLALIGPSGSGKGITERAAATLVPDIRNAGTRLPASGEGIPTMYTYRERGDDGSSRLKLSSPRSLLSMPEITHLGGAAKRVGSTLVSTLLSAYQGEPIGAANRAEDNRYEIPRLGYRLSLITGVQPSNANVILDNEGSGLPQRFLWFDVADPRTPMHAVSTPEVLSSLTCFPYPTSKLPPDPDKAVFEAYYNPNSDGIHKAGEYQNAFITVAFPDKAADDFECERIRANRGKTRDPLDAHLLQTAARVAALLAFLERPDAYPYVTETEWDNAKTILNKSAGYRTDCIRDMRATRSRDMADEFEITETAKAEVKQRGIENAKARITEYLQAHNPGREGIRGWRISQNVTRAYRQYTYDALADLYEGGHVKICGPDSGKLSGNSWRLS